MRRTEKGTGLGEEGIALITTLLVVLVTGALVMGTLILGSNHLLLDRNWSRQNNLVGLADGGLEVIRSHLNANPSLFPDSGYLTFEDGVPVQDVAGRLIPGVRRWTYAGSTGTTPGHPGASGNLVSLVRDHAGGVAIRRQQVLQESFARFAYFTDREDGNAYFGGNDHVWGPLHSNGQIRVHDSRATFHDEVTTAEGIYQAWNGSFEKGYREHSPAIQLPTTAELMNLRRQAQLGHAHVLGDNSGGPGEATTRIEFMAVDLNADGDGRDDDEGFFRVYQSDDSEWVSAKVTLSTYCTEWRGGRCAGWSTQHDIRGSENCGDYHNGRFVSAADHNPAVHGHDGAFALRSSSRRCHLGGSDELWNEFVADDGRGAWLPWRGPVHPKLRALRADADFLWPISRPNNPEFRGVIFVDGKVLVSGTVRGRVTVAATSDIVVGDDIIYATDPGAGSCEDIAGYFSGKKVVLSDNLLNAPAQVPGSSTYYTFDESASEFLHGVVLALDVFTVEDYSSGPTSAQYCEGKRAGRGCIYLSGGIVQSTRGAVGLPDGHGYVIRHSYDRCAATRPPPHFPTTGTFLKGQYYQVDPAGFDVEAFFSPIPPVGLAN